MATFALPVRLLGTALLLATAACGAPSAGDGSTGGEARRAVGGPCEGCEAALEREAAELGSTLRLVAPEDARSEVVELTGRVLEPDGVTPAEGVVLYAWHADEHGRYAAEPDATGWARRHGRLRGWLRTGEDGRYRIVTQRPAAYPSGSEPQHVHAVVVEEGLEPYWIDAWHFADDPLLGEDERNAERCRGGCGVVELTHKGDRLFAARHIVLGLHVPGHPGRR